MHHLLVIYVIYSLFYVVMPIQITVSAFLYMLILCP